MERWVPWKEDRKIAGLWDHYSVTERTKHRETREVRAGTTVQVRNAEGLEPSWTRGWRQDQRHLRGRNASLLTAIEVFSPLRCCLQAPPSPADATLRISMMSVVTYKSPHPQAPLWRLTVLVREQSTCDPHPRLLGFLVHNSKCQFMEGGDISPFLISIFYYQSWVI